MMKQFKKRLLRVFFVCEIAGFMLMYFCGPQGMYAIWCMEEENVELLKDIERLQKEIFQLRDHVTSYKSDESFYREKIAREQLQMAHKGDVVYYLS